MKGLPGFGKPAHLVRPELEKSFAENIKEGSYGWAALDAMGILADVVALLLPVVPGGVGIGVKALRAGGMAVDAAKAVRRVERGLDVASDIVKLADLGANAIQSYDAFQRGEYLEAALSAAGMGIRVGQADFWSFRRFVPGANSRWLLPSQARALHRSEYRRFRGQRYSRRAASLLADPYTAIPRRKGQHFIQQAVFRPGIQRFGEKSLVGRTLVLLRDNPWNVVRRRGMRTGRFYEYHARIHRLGAFGRRGSAQASTLLPGEWWRASRVADAPPPYGKLGYLWFGSPTALKITAAELSLSAGIWVGSSMGAGDDDQ